MAETEQTHNGDDVFDRRCNVIDPSPRTTIPVDELYGPTVAQVCDAICEIVDECQATELSPVGARLYIAEGLERRGIKHPQAIDLTAQAVMSMMLGNMVWDARHRLELVEATRALR